MLSLLPLCVLAWAQSAAAPTARELWSAGRRADAIDALRKELGDTRGETWKPLVAWQLAVHRPKQALADTARCGEPCDVLRADAHYALDEYELALPLFDERDSVHALKKVDALEALQRFDESDAALARAKERFGASDARFLGCEGRRLARAGSFDDAARAFRGALALDPLDSEARFGLGRALVSAGRRDEGLKVLEEHRTLVPLLDALQFAQRAIDLAPNHAPNYTAVGDAERALGRLAAAKSAYSRAEDLAHGDEVVPNALRLARLLAEDERDLDGALAALERASKKHVDARLLVRGGDLLAAAGRHAEAIAAYERGLALRPRDAEIAKRLKRARAAAR